MPQGVEQQVVDDLNHPETVGIKLGLNVRGLQGDADARILGDSRGRSDPFPKHGDGLNRFDLEFEANSLAADRAPQVLDHKEHDPAARENLSSRILGTRRWGALLQEFGVFGDAGQHSFHVVEYHCAPLARCGLVV